MIDLRSDTVTKPTEAMRAAIAEAEVGDDVYGDDPTVNALEARTAELLGKEAAVFVPTGSMSNQIALRAQSEPGDLVLIDDGAHIVRSEGGAGAAISGVTFRGLPSRGGIFEGAAIDAEMERPHPFNPGTLSPPARLVCVENSHSGGGGTLWSMAELRSVESRARAHGLRLHLDGARLWHAAAAGPHDERDLAAPFDTVNVCFSKGLGAPIGSALAGQAEVVARARRFKQQLGGGFRQAGIIAAAALYALDHHRSLLGADVRHARVLAEGLAACDGIDVDLSSVQSNIVRFRVTAMTAGDFVTSCHALGLHMLPGGDHGVRAVTHLDVGRAEVERALGIVREVLANQTAGSAS